MKVIMTGRRLLDIGAWDEVCEAKGWSVWAINEGRMSSTEEISLSDDELKKCPSVRGYLSRKMNSD